MEELLPPAGTDRIVCPKCGAVIYPGDVACQICGYFYGSAADGDDAGA